MKSLLLAMLVGLLMVGSLQPASASGGWLWFDKYPWIYSYKEQGWIYLSVQGGKLYAYRPSTKVWSEFTVTEFTADTASAQTSTDTSNSNATSHFDPSDPPKSWTTSSTSNIEMIWVEPGTFLMGSPETESITSSTETQHQVTLTNGFYLGKYEVTQAQYKEVMKAVMTGNTSGPVSTPNRPVEEVSWDDVEFFLARLNASEQAAGRLPAGWKYVLPTEAQWEYACRAGTTTIFSWGNSAASTQANFDGTQPYGGGASGTNMGRTVDVGQYAPNPWGFHDMHGNVWEWTADWYGAYPTGNPAVDPTGPASGWLRVKRGGCWFNDGSYLRSARRHYYPQEGGHNGLGFRVCFQKQ